MLLRWLMLSVVLGTAGCTSPARGVLTPSGMETVSWTPEDETQEIAVRHLRKTESASHHIVRLAGAEKPHIHEKSDLTVTVLSGRVRMHLASHVFIVRPGQVIDIPRGTPHYAENINSGVSEAYTVFSPPLQKGDNRPLPAD